VQCAVKEVMSYAVCSKEVMSCCGTCRYEGLVERANDRNNGDSVGREGAVLTCMKFCTSTRNPAVDPSAIG
jgi:hypothetical protein